MNKPVTDAELDQFYGREVQQWEINEAIGRHARAFDEDDLYMIVNENFTKILDLLRNSLAGQAGLVIDDARRVTIARRASMELYGKPDVIKPSEVTL